MPVSECNDVFFISSLEFFRGKTIIAMTIARRGAEVGIRRCHALRNGAGNDTDSNGRLSTFGVEPPHVICIDAVAAPNYADGCGFFSC